MRVSLFDHSGSDRHIAAYFWASTDKVQQAWTCPIADVERVIRFGMKAQPVAHGSPFGHSVATFWCTDIPLFVVAQWERHRTQNYSEESFRYVVSEGDYYVPEPVDVRGQKGRPGRYLMTGLKKGQVTEGIAIVRRNGMNSVLDYNALLALGWAPELARTVLPTGSYKRLFATASLRNWLGFLAQRTDDAAQLEIRHCANAVERQLTDLYPVTMRLWNEAGRRVV